MKLLKLEQLVEELSTKAMAAPQLEKLTEAANGDTSELIKVIDEAAKEFAKVEAALSEVRKLTSKLPSLFRSNVWGGNIHNLDTPNEYPIWVDIENLKDMYGVSKEVREARQYFESAKRRLKAYKPSEKKK